MVEKFKKYIGVDWRVPLYRRWMQYARRLKNYQDLIRYQKTGEPFDHLTLRNSWNLKLADPKHGIQVFDEIWLYENYTRYYHQLKPSIVVDIGANIGMFTIFAKHSWPHSTVFAYEPSPENFHILIENIESNHISGVIHYPFAVANAIGQRTFYLKNEEGWHSLQKQSGESIREAITVQTTTLREILKSCGNQIDFLKIDCEGGEWEFLIGSEKLLPSISYIAMEYHEINGHKKEELIILFEKAGFETKLTDSDAWGTGRLYAHPPG